MSLTGRMTTSRVQSARCSSDLDAICVGGWVAGCSLKRLAPRAVGLAHEWRETCSELGRPADHRSVVAGKLDQRRIERGGQRLGAAMGVEVASLLARGDDDPLRDR